MLASLLGSQLIESEEAPCYNPGIFIMVSFFHRTSLRSQGLMISASLLSDQSKNTCFFSVVGFLVWKILFSRDSLYFLLSSNILFQKNIMWTRGAVYAIVRCINPNQPVHNVREKKKWKQGKHCGQPISSFPCLFFFIYTGFSILFHLHQTSFCLFYISLATTSQSFLNHYMYKT